MAATAFVKKRIVIISEIKLSDEATGMSQTLVNLFDNYPSESLLFCTPKKSSGKLRNIRCLPYKGALLNNSFSKKIIPASLEKKYFEKIKVPIIIKKILRFKPELVLISNLDYDSSLITFALLQKKKLPLCVYLMDYISQENKKIFDYLIEPLMKNADRHIFISTYMAEKAMADYPNVKNYTVIHNPVEEKEIAATSTVDLKKTKITFAYAGSLWQMHLDAVLSFSKALQVLNEQGTDASLVVYTAPYFHKANKHHFDSLKIIYGGFYSFDMLKPHLLQHKALLVASSFDKAYYDLSAYSVQTKVTDYLSCGVPVISIGPDCAACNRFITEHDCGFTIQTNDTISIATEIERYLQKNRTCIQQAADNGLRLIRENYAKPFVQDKLYRFLLA